MRKRKLRAISVDSLDDNIISQIRLWRNQDFVRREMFNKQLITEEEHCAWIKEMIKDPRRDLYVFFLDDKPLGVYQFRVMEDGESIEVGTYLVDEELKELGYGTIMMYAFAQIAYRIFRYKRDVSKVLATNGDVIKMNRRFGIEPIKEYFDENGEKVFCFCYEFKEEKEDSFAYKLFNRLIYEEPWEKRVIRKKSL